MNRRQIIGGILLAGAVVAAAVLQLLGLLSTEIGRQSVAAGALHVEAVAIEPNWFAVVPIAAVVLAGIACLITAERNRQNP